ncbi:DUF5302 domain-containing protein [Parenemella sanctibonifatiensis]|uniref:DUF5302 domain-containing protein n=1 Tax=Parenemella sanctibonifatiensis TaxID=2016505 RepID=A0A255E7K3_9ACTN|nr:DUF5302 domain-containing protein [Parenemella sanctibonifatiensis]OYN87506.1 hypothetical protein CGZ92_07270 [Parenemella sanctibonifatiensis]OYN88980.1 hypothetical protein CGZ91_11935 [Parenemella sanctibonifatiensis]
MSNNSRKKPDPSGADDIKEKMREALERKKQRSHPTEGAVGVDPEQKMHGVSGHVDTQSYRRKAGGGGS